MDASRRSPLGISTLQIMNILLIHLKFRNLLNFTDLAAFALGPPWLGILAPVGKVVRAIFLTPHKYSLKAWSGSEMFQEGIFSIFCIFQRPQQCIFVNNILVATFLRWLLGIPWHLTLREGFWNPTGQQYTGQWQDLNSNLEAALELELVSRLGL